MMYGVDSIPHLVKTARQDMRCEGHMEITTYLYNTTDPSQI